jgi:hypothetical protein
MPVADGGRNLLPDRRESWWAGYAQRLLAQGVPERHVHWHRLRVEQLLARHPGVAVARLGQSQVVSHLQHVAGWQASPWVKCQAVDALERFAADTGCAWGEAIDWGDWRRRLEVAADAAELADLQRGILPDDPALRAFALHLRGRQCGLRTERTYLDWTIRCQRFHRLATADLLAESHVAPFLSHLAADRQVSAQCR